jgi:hypothetical protein
VGRRRPRWIPWSFPRGFARWRSST